MQEEEVVRVDNFEPRWYQKHLINALEHEGKKKFVIVWRAARAGAFNVEQEILCLHKYNYFGFLSDRQIEYRLDEFDREIDEVIKEKL